MLVTLWSVFYITKREDIHTHITHLYKCTSLSYTPCRPTVPPGAILLPVNACTLVSYLGITVSSIFKVRFLMIYLIFFITSFFLYDLTLANPVIGCIYIASTQIHLVIGIGDLFLGDTNVSECLSC